MPHARDARIARPTSRRTSSKAALNRRLRRWLAKELVALRPVVAASSAACAADRYRKHFTALQHTCLLLFHGLARLPSLRQSYAAFGQCTGLAAVCGLDQPTADGSTTPGVSYSQLAASNTSRPPAFLEGVFAALLPRVQRLGQRGGAAGPPAALCALDSTFLRVCLKLAPWLAGSGGGPHIAAVRVQVTYTPALDLPEHILITSPRTNDCLGLDQAILDIPERLATLQDRTLVFDLGFYSHLRLARLRAAGVHFVTRRCPQATLTVLAARPLQPPFPTVDAAQRIQVTADQCVQVGSRKNKRGAILSHLRLVTATVTPTKAAARQHARSQTYEILTDRWDFTPTEVVQAYLWRWSIELFFRWFKHVLQGQRLLGYSPQACELTVWLAMVVHLLCLLAAHALAAPRRSPALLAQLMLLLALITPAELAQPTHPPPTQRCLPGFEQEGSPDATS